MAQQAADFALDDEDDHAEYRASGAVRANGGETLTIVVSGYGGGIGGREDVGRGVLALATHAPGIPSLTQASVSLEGTELGVDVDGSDPDGDVREVRLRFAGREGSPIARVPLEIGGARGDFHAHAALDVGPIGAQTMGSASSVEVALVDHAENASPPLEVPLSVRAPDATAPPAPAPVP